jgi:hypothetical protein
MGEPARAGKRIRAQTRETGGAGSAVDVSMTIPVGGCAPATHDQPRKQGKRGEAQCATSAADESESAS